ncbi:hypothetical protein [Pleionea sp. CnH1-48]|uniref:hypothetical protein n=1 Tax=Pleionea sp. CnH1-48 TaxID=2954494 RepID=UPI00209701D7|nr:hypothetical protein [Pleionea sp. CnH1-48]MCO7224470.1 hypothetical protein [Pleionea sp. CnH1-48]
MKWTLTSASLLCGGVIVNQYWQSEDYEQLLEDEHSYGFLQQEDRIILLALAPVILGPSLLQNWQQKRVPLSRMTKNVDLAIGFLPARTQQELRELFDLLWNRLGKLLLAGVWASWSSASQNTLNDFLTGWRESWLPLLNSGYLGIQQLVMAAYYSEKPSWEMCGYDGPWEL